MAEHASPDIRSVDDLELIVDTDVHLTERQDDFLPYIEEPFHRMLQRGTGEDYGLHSNLYPKSGVFSPLTTGKTDSATLRSRNHIKTAMRDLHTDRVIITPTLNPFLGLVQHTELAAALASAYNEWVLDEIVDVDAGIYAAGVVAPQLPDKAAEEIDDRATEPGIVAVLFPSGGVSPPLGNQQYYPIYAAAEAHGLPVLFHNTSTGSMFNFPFQYQGYTRFLTTHIFHVVQHIVNLPDLIFQGVPVRFPDLTFVIQEGGLGWVPYMMNRLDHDYSAMREDAPMLEKLPSEYLRDQFYYSSQPIEGLSENPVYVRQILQLMAAEDTLMFATDYPHFDFDHTNEFFNLLRREFKVDTVNQIFGGAAADVFAW